MSARRAVEPIATILALWVREALLLFTFGTLAIHLAIGDIVFENQTAFSTNLGIAAVIWCFATRHRANKNCMTRVTPVLATCHFFTNRALFHRDTSINIISGLRSENTLTIAIAARISKINISQQNVQSELVSKKPDLQGPAFLEV